MDMAILKKKYWIVLIHFIYCLSFNPSPLFAPLLFNSIFSPNEDVIAISFTEHRHCSNSALNSDVIQGKLIFSTHL